jgi:hypothetical protein
VTNVLGPQEFWRLISAELDLPEEAGLDDDLEHDLALDSIELVLLCAIVQELGAEWHGDGLFSRIRTGRHVYEEYASKRAVQ